MADINVERKGPSVWPWIIGLIVLAVLIWALVSLFGGDDDAAGDRVVGDTVSVQPAPEPSAAAAAIPVAQILQNPSAHAGQSFSGEVEVAEVEGERGFWVRDPAGSPAQGQTGARTQTQSQPQQGRGDRLFVLVRNGATDEGAARRGAQTGGQGADTARPGAAAGMQGVLAPRDLQPGQRVHLMNATVHEAGRLDQLDADLDPRTRSTVEGQPAFLAVDRNDIHRSSTGPGQPGRDTGAVVR